MAARAGNILLSSQPKGQRYCAKISECAPFPYLHITMHAMRDPVASSFVNNKLCVWRAWAA